MKRIILLACLMACLVVQAFAQVTAPAASGVRDSRTLTFPYTGRAIYAPVQTDKVPQNIQSSFSSDYGGINNARWEYNDDVYRSSFMQDGKRRAVLYGQDGRMIETRTGMTVNDLPASVKNAMREGNASSPYEVRVGGYTYYSTQVDGKEVFYDADGHVLDVPDSVKK